MNLGIPFCLSFLGGENATSSLFEQIELPAKLLDYCWRSCKSNINQSGLSGLWTPSQSLRTQDAGSCDAESGLPRIAAVFIYICHGTCAPEHTLCQICHQSFWRRARRHHGTLFNIDLYGTLVFGFLFAVPPNPQPSHYMRNAYKWCAVMGWSVESRHTGTLAMDLEVTCIHRKTNRRVIEQNTHP